jgi:hypothetical protein
VVYYDQNGENPYGVNVARMDSHGGWLATASDLVRFAVRVDGFADPPDLLAPPTIAMMTTPTAANGAYARGWSVNRHGNWWHTGSLPGTTAILVRTARGLCWAALLNSRRRRSEIPGALDRMMWEMADKVAAWRT